MGGGGWGRVVPGLFQNEENGWRVVPETKQSGPELKTVINVFKTRNLYCV